MADKRIFLIVLDSLGIGALPDAKAFGDEHANTLKSISSSKYFDIPTLASLGIANIEGNEYLTATDKPIGAYARMAELSAGKDTTIGHWEIAGVVSNTPLPTYPDGFPEEIISKFKSLTQRDVLCNKPYSGTDVIRDYGREHLETGALIVYTSADSVFQIAAHEDKIPVQQLYKYCEMAREILVGEHAVGRVIARPFTGEYPNFKRTSNRHDYSLEPPGQTMLDAIKNAGHDVIAIGKINDIFAGRGITEYLYTKSNSDGMQKLFDMQKKKFNGICFLNLVDFDSSYGHRNDIDGYATALSTADSEIAEFMKSMNDDDILMICADHGCDPGDISTDHTREYTPLLIYGKNIAPVDLGTRSSFSDIAATICELLNVSFSTVGKSFADKILRK